MAGRRVAEGPLNGRQEKQLRRLQKEIQDQGLSDMLDSFPSPDTFSFQKTQKHGHDAIKLMLGNRPKSNGKPCQVWARIVSSHRKDLKPPVLFYDQEFSDDGTRTLQYPRSASSLLRKATDLQPPFCFLQHDPIDEATGLRGMLGALILYQAVVTGADTCALQWVEFQDSLSRALQYINTRGAYHQWQHERKIASLQQPKANEMSNESAHEEVEQELGEVEADDPATDSPRTASPPGGDDFTGGIVRPSGSSVLIRPGTSLARLKDQLGDNKWAQLDNMPRLPMTVMRHNLGDPYFAFRMHIASDRYESGENVDVYAYLVHDRAKNAVMKFRSHSDTGHEQSYTMEQLEEEAILFEPFEYLNNLKSKSSGAKPGSSARAAKIRSVIAYYFFLAENEGLIGDPRITVGEAFGKRLCAACAELQEVDLSEDVNERTRNGNESDVDGVDSTSTNNDAPDAMVTDEEQNASDMSDPRKASSRRTFKRSTRIPGTRTQTYRKLARQPPGSCKSCVRRHQKCDRSRPTCGRCVQLGFPCGYSQASDGTGDDTGIDDNAQNRAEDDAAIDTSVQAPADPSDAIEGSNEQLGSHKSDPELSAMVALKLRPDILTDVSQTGPHNHGHELPDADAEQHRPKDASSEPSLETVQAHHPPRGDFDTSSHYSPARASPEVAEICFFLSAHEDEAGENGFLATAALFEASKEIKSEPTHNPTEAVISKLQRSKSEREEGVSGPASTIVEENCAAAQLSNVDAPRSQDVPPIDGEGGHNNLVTGAEKVQVEQPSVHGASKRNRPRVMLVLLQDDTDDESVPMDMLSPSSPMKSIQQYSGAQSITASASSRPHKSSSVSGATVFSTLVFHDKPPTPEPSAERELKAPSTVAAVHMSLDIKQIIDLTYDDEPDFAPSILRNKVERTPESNERPRDEVDLTQLSSSPRGKKRKSAPIVYLDDKDDGDDVFEEVDEREWRRKARGHCK